MFAILRREGPSEMRFSPRPEQGEGTSHVAIQNKMFQADRRATSEAPRQERNRLVH